MSKGAEGWIRHRGGKAPVGDYAVIEYRMRSGQVMKTGTGGMLNWDHGNWPTDIMAYRLHKPAEQVAPFIEAVQAFNELAKVQQLDGPTGWRDRITEIDSTTQALTTERAELVQKLASEGFALIGRINELLTDAARKHEDMSDPKNWKEGDVIESVDDAQVDIDIGAEYQLIASCNGKVVRFRDNDGDIRDRPADLYKFHSRPSA